MKFKQIAIRVLVLLVVLIGVAVGVYAQTWQAPTQASSLQSTYTDTELGITINIPNSWQMSKAFHTVAWTIKGSQTPAFHISRDDLMWLANKESYGGGAIGGKSPNDPIILLTPEPYPTLVPVTDLGSEIAKIVSSYEPALRQQIKVTNRTVGNMPSFVVTGLPNNGDPCVFISVLHKSHLYVIEACDNLGTLSLEQEAAINSIKFID